MYVPEMTVILSLLASHNMCGFNPWTPTPHHANKTNNDNFLIEITNTIRNGPHLIDFVFILVFI